MSLTTDATQPLLAFFGPLIGFGTPIGSTLAEFNSGAFIDMNQVQPYSAAQLAAVNYSGVYAGSLSSQGNMVAMQMNPGGPNQDADGTLIPYLTGYFRQYLKDPRQCTFGSDSAIPAITGVMPSKYSSTPGNLFYYIDIQMTRLTGNNTFDPKYFINAFSQALSWAITSNGYIVSLNNAQDTNMAYHGALNTAEMITSGLDVLAKSNAVKLAMKNQGIMVQSIPNGNFGTPNAVTQTLIESGLGAINDLSSTLLQNGITLQNISSNNYTAFLTQTLSNITKPSDLETIQFVVESTIPKMTSALDYTSIEKSSGINNDSEYATMADIGAVIYKRGTISQFNTGQDVYNLLANLTYNVPDSVDSIYSQESMLKKAIVDDLRSYLPVSPGNKPIGVVNVVGMASGYLTSYVELVNEGLAALAATDYGAQITSTLSTISRYEAKIPADAAEAATARNYTPVPPPEYIYDGEGGSTLISAGGPDYYALKSQQYQTEYYNILANVVADPSNSIKAIVKQINDNYDVLCSQTNLEYQNWMKANLQVSGYGDNTLLFSFVSSLPAYGADKDNLGTDLVLYNMAQDNDSGNLVKVVLEQAKNASLLANVNIRPLGTL